MMKRSDGYISIADESHPNSSKGWIRRSRWIMSKKLGRPLTSQEVVDHINGIKTDDSLDNLRILTAASHGQIGYNPGRFTSEERGPTPEWIKKRISEAKQIKPWKPTEEQLQRMKEKRNAYRKDGNCKECNEHFISKSATSIFCSKKCSKRFHRKLQIK